MFTSRKPSQQDRGQSPHFSASRWRRAPGSHSPAAPYRNKFHSDMRAWSTIATRPPLLRRNHRTPSPVLKQQVANSANTFYTWLHLLKQNIRFLSVSSRHINCTLHSLKHTHTEDIHLLDVDINTDQQWRLSFCFFRWENELVAENRAKPPFSLIYSTVDFLDIT